MNAALTPAEQYELEEAAHLAGDLVYNQAKTTGALQQMEADRAAVYEAALRRLFGEAP